ncbi:unnamed protein product, partial [Effrenium voratum]
GPAGAGRSLMLWRGRPSYSSTRLMCPRPRFSCGPTPSSQTAARSAPASTGFAAPGTPMPSPCWARRKPNRSGATPSLPTSTAAGTSRSSVPAVPLSAPRSRSRRSFPFRMPLIL